MGPDFGRALADAMSVAFVMLIIIVAGVSIGLWELLAWLYRHVSITWV